MSIVSAALLAGGKSTRMGQDKCLIKVNGIPMWRRQLDLLLSLSPEVFAVAPHRPEWLPPTVSWLQDAAQNEGPIGGLAAVLAQATYQNVLVLAVDMPGMTSDFLKKMLVMMGSRGGIVPQIGERYEPLCAIYPCIALSVVRDQLFVKRDNALQALLHCLIRSGLMHSFSVLSSELCLFRNLNFPSDCLS
jgi:molybdopterin-guanine dinucleotide biosynthesis protein A